LYAINFVIYIFIRHIGSKNTDVTMLYRQCLRVGNPTSSDKNCASRSRTNSTEGTPSAIQSSHYW